jgi:hypothetical protein
MSRVAGLAALLLVCATALAPAAAAEKRVYKVDSVIATVKGHKLVIQAKGAVQTGGWKGARLHLIRSGEGKTVAVEFLATPPPPNMTVIEALVPVEATLELQARPHIVNVRAVADANEVTSQILH